VEPLNPNWLVAPVVLPLALAALSLIFVRWGYRQAVKWQQAISIVAVLANLGVSLAILEQTLSGTRLVLQVSAWQAPFGITVVADGLTAIMLTITAILALTVLLYAMGTLDQRARMNFYPSLLFLLMGVNGAYLAGDLFNLYVFFEVLLMASFVLLTLGGRTAQISGGIRYVVLNLLASTFFLAAAGLAYGTLGTLNMAQLAQRMPDAPLAIQHLLAGLMLVAFGSKAGLFPLYAWLPSSYHTPHPAVTAFFGGLLTKVGVYTLFRIFPLLFPNHLAEWQPLLLTVAGLTMILGIWGGMAAITIRRALSFQIVSHVGFIIMGLGLTASSTGPGFKLGLTAAILYMVHHMIAKTALLMAGGAVELEMQSGTLAGRRLSGLMSRRPFLAFIFFLSAMSLAGIPPASGFVSKLGLLQVAFSTGHWIIAGVSLLVSFLTLVNIGRIWQTAFWGTPSQPIYPTAPLTQPRRRWLIMTPITLLLLVSLAIGIFSGPVYRWSDIAARQVMDREGYIEAVGPTDEIKMLKKEKGEESDH